MMFRRVARWDRINLTPDHSIDTYLARLAAINNDMFAQRRRHRVSAGPCGPARFALRPVGRSGLLADSFQINAGGA